MEGTLSARPEGVVVSARKGHQSDKTGSKFAGALALKGAFLERGRVFLHLGAAFLALAAAAAHVVDPVPVAVAPICAAAAALLVMLAAGSNSPTSKSSPLVPVKTAEPETARDSSSSQERSASESPRFRHSAAEANANLGRELAQAAQLAQLTARISHELRTPLNAVIGFSELMSKETFGPLGSQRYQDYAAHIRECGQSLLKSTEDTLAITSALAEPMGERSAGGVCALPLAAIVDEAWECVARNAARECRSLERDLGDGLEVFGERLVIRQILVNLLQDAMSRERGQGVIKVRAMPDGLRIRLSIETKDLGEHSGDETLALCVARALAELHGLPVTASLDGQGARMVSVRFDRALQPDLFIQSRPSSRAGASA